MLGGHGGSPVIPAIPGRQSLLEEGWLDEPEQQILPQRETLPQSSGERLKTLGVSLRPLHSRTRVCIHT